MAQTNIDLAQNVSNLIGASGGGKKTPTKTPTVTPEELSNFGNWTGQADTKVMAADLAKRGLIGASQLITDSPDKSNPNNIINSQSDWKPAAIAKIVSNARRYNLRKPEELLANKKVLMNTLDPRIQDAINDKRFQQIHPNFWQVITHSIIPEQWAKLDASNKQNVATSK